MSELQVGQFVRSFENDLGIGKVGSVDDGMVTIEYFDSPTSEDRPTRTLPAQVVEPTELHQETRVYFRHPATGVWYIGRALIKVGDSYRVQFPNRKVAELPQSALFARWQRPIEDPTDHLAHRVNETPYFHDGRAPFRASLVEQRAACAGMTGLFSSVIELEEHQIEVVRRVLEDPIQRYLLADEVGLGKTIEAGAIMRQYALDRPRDFGILVVVPPHLTEQWEEELAQRFLFDQELGERVHVVPHTDIGTIVTLAPDVGMVVVDEAHQVAQYANAPDSGDRQIYEVLASVTSVTRKLLLLSATPVLHNESGYLAMLHLLDPNLYPLDDVDGFRKRVRARQEIAELFHTFRAEADDDELLGLVDQIIDYFPDDDRLNTLTEDIRSEISDGGDDENREALVDSVRTHISETYRLHRRILRTPHSEETQWLLPGRAQAKVIEFDAEHRQACEELLEKWRVKAAAEADDEDGRHVELFQSLFAAAASLPDTLGRVVEDRLTALSEDSETSAFEGEDTLLVDLAEAVKEAVQADHSIDELVAYLETFEEKEKAVVFVSDQVDADRVFARLDEELETRVVRHQVVRHTGEAQWKEFLSEAECQVLVCDRRAEEGLNLQGSQARLVHLDLPLSPSRLEQRIGRLDRYGTGQPVESTVLRPTQSEYMKRLLELHDEGLGVFQRSISALHYLVEDRLAEMWPQILENGLDVMSEFAAQLGGDDGEMAVELERVRAQDDLDALEASREDEEEFYDRLWDVDFDAERLEAVAYEWIRNRLQFHRTETSHEHEKIFRYEYRTDRTAKHPTLLPIRELLGRFAVAVDHRVNGFFSYPMSFHRGAANTHKVRVARIGEPFISAMMDYVRWDDRGTSFAMWRHTPRAELVDDPGLYFRFDFVVEADIAGAVDALEGYENITEEAVRLRADGLFPPLMDTVWVRGDGGPVDDAEVMELLELPYDQEGVKRFGRDYNLNSERWEEIEKFFDREAWEARCHEVRAEAEDVLFDQLDLNERCTRYADRAQKMAQTNIERLQIRVARGADAMGDVEAEQLEMEEALIAALEEGIRTPKIRLDSIGAIFLSTVSPFEEVR